MEKKVLRKIIGWWKAFEEDFCVGLLISTLNAVLLYDLLLFVQEFILK